MYLVHVGFEANNTKRCVDGLVSFENKPSVEEIIERFSLADKHLNDGDDIIMRRAVENMLNGNVGYYFGILFIMREF